MKKKNLLMNDNIYILQKNIFRNNLWLFVITVTLIQSIFIYYTDFGYSSLAFMNGAYFTNQYNVYNIMLMFWVFPLFAILYYFSNNFCDDNFRYDIMLIVRSKKRKRYLFKKVYYFYKQLFILLSIQIIIYIPSFFILNDLKIVNLIYMIVMHFNVLITLIILQFILEMFIKSNLATTIVMIYIILSNILDNILKNNMINNKILDYLLFPKLACGFKNGSLTDSLTFNNYSNILIIILIQVCIIVIGKIKINSINLGVD